MADRNLLAQSAAEIEQFPDVQPDVEEWPDAFGQADQTQADLPEPQSTQTTEEPSRDFPEAQQRQVEDSQDWPNPYPSLEQTTAEFPEQQQAQQQPTQPTEWPQAQQQGEQQTDWPQKWPGSQPEDISTADPFQGMTQQQNADGGITFSMYAPPDETQQQQSMPSGSGGVGEAKQDAGLYDLLKQIADGISALTGAKQQGAPQDAGAKGYQFPWGEMGFAPLEQTETYSQASPSFPMTTTLNGMRGAGGPAGGSKQGSQSQADFMFPQRHHIGEEE